MRLKTQENLSNTSETRTGESDSINETTRDEESALHGTRPIEVSVISMKRLNCLSSEQKYLQKFKITIENLLFKRSSIYKRN